MIENDLFSSHSMSSEITKKTKLSQFSEKANDIIEQYYINSIDAPAFI